MATTINANNTDGVVITPDTSGELELQANGVTKAKVTANGLQDANGNSLRGGSFRNLIINGNFDVWQRSTNSGAVGGSGYWAADRWWSQIGSGSSSMTLSQQSFTAGQTDVPHEPTYFHRYTQTGTSTGAGNFHQRIEDVRTAAGKTVTLSFYAKASTAMTVNTYATQNFGSGGSTAVSTASQANSITTSWQKFTHIITIPSISGKTIGSSSYLRILFEMPIGAGFNFDLAQVQLEVGEGASDFEFLPYDVQLARCERYFQKVGQWVGAANNTTNWLGMVSAHNTMRTSPSVGQSGILQVSNFYTQDINQSATSVAVLNYNLTSLSLCIWIFNLSGMTAGSWYAGQRGNGNVNFITLSAEL